MLLLLDEIRLREKRGDIPGPDHVKPTTTPASAVPHPDPV